MNIHKINSTSQEHQNFLAQNRKDPITGDSILEGDEVVFCAGCKSVFLKDTWEYLGNQHCEQSKTLIDFPLGTVKLNLAKEVIFFYTFINQPDSPSIPSLYGSKWKIKTRELSEYHRLFNGAPITFVVVFGFIITSMVGCVNQNGYSFFCGFIFLLIGVVSRYVHNSIHGEKLDTIHRKFTNNVFFISTTGIGFSTAYGIKEHILSASEIKSLDFNFTLSVECVIKYKKGKKTTFSIRNFFKEKRPKRFLQSVHKLSEKHAVPIHIKVSKNSDYNIVANFINSNQSNISVSLK